MTCQNCAFLRLYQCLVLPGRWRGSPTHINHSGVSAWHWSTCKTQLWLTGDIGNTLIEPRGSLPLQPWLSNSVVNDSVNWHYFNITTDVVFLQNNFIQLLRTPNLARISKLHNGQKQLKNITTYIWFVSQRVKWGAIVRVHHVVNLEIVSFGWDFVGTKQRIRVWDQVLLR